MDITIAQISLSETYPTHRAVLYPDGPEHRIHIPNDDQGVHFGALRRPAAGSGLEVAKLSGEIISVISLFREPLPAHLAESLYPGENLLHVDDLARTLRFRNFACLKAYQGLGIGTNMLQHVITIAKNDSNLGPGSVIWCDARRSTEGWYLKRGMKVLGNPFLKGDIEYIVMAIIV